MKIFYSRKDTSRYLTNINVICSLPGVFSNVRIACNCENCKDEQRFSSRFCLIFTSQFLRRPKEERKATREQSRLFHIRWKFGEGYATLVAFRVERMCISMLLKFIVYCSRTRTHTYVE